MKNKVVIAIPLAAILIAATVFATTFSGKSKTQEELELLENNYGNTLYESFYSISTLRPFSIIQLESTIEMYDNSWIKPEDIVAGLSEDEKDQLLTAIAAYIEDSSTAADGKVMYRVRNWCIAKRQFDYLSNTVGLSETQLLGVLLKVEQTEDIVNEFNRSGSVEMEKLTPLNRNEAVYKALDFLSELELNQQMNYYSGLYNQLSTFAFEK